MDDADFRAMNLHGKVPVLVDGATIVWESTAILRYLVAAYGPESGIRNPESGIRNPESGMR